MLLDIALPPAVLYDGTSENLRGESRVKFQIELDREEDGHWIADNPAATARRQSGWGRRLIPN
jgi:hypothetical protein